VRKPIVDPAKVKPTGLPLFVRFWLGWLVFWLAITAVSHWVKPEAANGAKDVNSHAAEAGVKAAPLTAYVNDFAGALRPELASRLNFSLAQFETDTSNQIALVIYPALPATPVEEFTIAVAELSRLGRKGLDNGAILSVFVKDKVARLEVGYGLEGVLTDVDVRRILESKLVPAWITTVRVKAVDDTLLAVMALVRESYKAQKMPGRVAVFWRQLRVAVPKLAHGALPKLVAVPWYKRLASAFFGGLIMTPLCLSLGQSGRFLSNSFLAAKNYSASKSPAAAEKSGPPRGLLQWLNSPASPGFGSLVDLVKVVVAVIALTSILIGVVVSAGGGAFGGAGSLLRW